MTRNPGPLLVGLLLTGVFWSSPGLAQIPIMPNPPGAVPVLPVTPTPGEEQKRVDIAVPLGEAFKMRPESGLPIKDAFIDREAVLKFDFTDKKSPFIKVRGVGMGDARVTLVDSSGAAKTYQVRVLPSVGFLKIFLERQFPGANVTLTAGGDSLLFVEGAVDTPGQVEQIAQFLEKSIGKDKIVNNLRVTGVTQIQLDVCIARVDRRELRKLNLNVLGSDKNNFFGTQIGNLIGVPGINVRGGDAIGGAKVFNPSATIANQVLSANSTVFFGLTNENSALFGFLEFLKRNGIVKVLANPTLVTTNGRPADFLVGGEQPVPNIVFAGGVAQPNTQFKAFGTKLTFVPVLMGEGKIRLDVLPEVSTVNFAAGINIGGSQVPQFVTQRIHTTVELESGQTLYLGGLLQNEVEAETSKIPILGDMPVIGAAFRSVSHQQRETELVIVVTPKLVAPLRDCRKPKLPGHETRDPTESELFLHGKIETAPIPPHLNPGGKTPYAEPILPGTGMPFYEPHLGPTHGPFGGQAPTPSGTTFGPFGPGMQGPAPTPAPPLPPTGTFMPRPNVDAAIPDYWRRLLPSANAPPATWHSMLVPKFK